MSRRGQFITLLATIIGSGAVFLDGSVVNLALPNLAHSLHADFADLQWVVDGYLLSLSALILLGGSLGDIFGRKRVYMIGLAGFGLASLLCGLAPNITVLIAMRILQGLFGALLVPGSLAIITSSFAAEARGTAIGRWAAWSGMAPALGPLLGGYLIDIASWRWIFFINVPLIIICCLLTWKGVRESRGHASRRLDLQGAALAVVALAGFTYGLIEGPAQHWRPVTIIALLIGFIFMALFIRAEARHKDPMVQLNFFRSRNFTGANVATFAMYGALSGFFFALVIYLQNTLHYSSLQAGMSLLPVSVFMLFFSGRIGGLAATRGPRLFMTVGPLVCALGIATMIGLHLGQSYLTGVLPGVVLFAIGLSLTVAPLTTTVMSSVGDADSGIASAINNAVSRVAGLVVVALLGLFGAAQMYHFSAVFCVGLTVAAGVLSWLLVRNPSRKKLEAVREVAEPLATSKR